MDGGAEWLSLQLNLATTAITDLIIKGDDLAVAINGRSFWILDDVNPLRQLTPQLASEDVILYKPGATYRLQFPEGVDKRRPVGENPPNGAIVSYYLKAEAKDEITLDILDSAEKPVRHYSSKPQNKF